MRKLVYNTEKNEAYHVERSTKDNLRRHRRFSHVQGDIVELIGKDKKIKGFGIVLYETNVTGLNIDTLSEELRAQVKDEDFTHLHIFWQITMQEETIHKSFVKKIPDVKRDVRLSQFLDEVKNIYSKE